MLVKESINNSRNIFKLFQANFSFLYPQKTEKRLFDIFEGGLERDH